MKMKSSRGTRKRANVATLNVVTRKRGRVQRVRSAPIQVRRVEFPDVTSDLPEPFHDQVDSGDHDIPSRVVDSSGAESEYSRRQLNAVERWEKIRELVLRATVESTALPPGAQCCSCNAAPAEIRCLQCGSNVLLCQNCTLNLHCGSGGRYSHTPEIWMVSASL